ncbi:MAG TPA: DUF4432 family protein [Baekduia sp.]
MAAFDLAALGSPEQVASAVSSVVAEGPAAGCRAIDLRVLNGVDLRVLPDRGLDLGAAWYRGVPLAWVSALGERRALAAAELEGTGWRAGFGGGLGTTCGLANVGAPSEGHGLHGSCSHQPARDVAVERAADALVVRGVVRDGDLELRRMIVTRIGAGEVRVEDVVRNRGGDVVPAPILYHVNLGAPLWSPPARLRVGTSGRTDPVPRDDDAALHLAGWDRAPGVVPGAVERVYEHGVSPAPDGWAQAVVRNPALHLTLTLRWDAATLPRLHQWVHPAPGMGVLGLEPANCSVLGRAADRAQGRLPVLAPGAERRTRIAIRVSG